VSVLVAESYDAFGRLEPRWKAIADAGGVRTPYQSFVWLDQWLRHRGRGVQPFVLVLEDGATIAPLGRLRIGGVRLLRLIGTGDSDYPGLVTSLPLEEAWDSVARELARRRRAWDLLHLHSVREREAITEALVRHIGPHGRARSYDVCPWVSTDRSWEDLLASRKRGFRKNVKRWGRQLEALGEISVKVMPPPIPEEIIAEMEMVERASWKWELGNAALRPGSQRDFLCGLVQDPRMQIKLWLLRISGRLVAFDLVLVAQESWYCYLGVFRQDYPHAGSYNLARIIETACSSRSTCVDLLRGPQAYKYDWADHEKVVYEIVWPSTLRGEAAALAYAARWRAAKSPILQRIRARLMNTGDRRSTS
jgi:CelD/BcsL family acetyltransferase involved in cellulose biosynthesis